MQRKREKSNSSFYMPTGIGKALTMKAEEILVPLDFDHSQRPKAQAKAGNYEQTLITEIRRLEAVQTKPHEFSSQQILGNGSGKANMEGELEVAAGNYGNRQA
jgi:hypothetical protein